MPDRRADTRQPSGRGCRSRLPPLLQKWADSGETGRIEAALRAAADPALAAHLARQKAQTFDGSFLKPIDAPTREAKRADEAARYEAAAGRSLTLAESLHLARKWAAEGPARYGVSPGSPAGRRARSSPARTRTG